MIQIFIHNGNNSGFLDIASDAQLTIEALQAAFDEDYSIGEFSLPIEIVWTPANRRILGFSERMQNIQRKDYYWRCDVYDNGWPEIANGKFSLLEKAGTLNYSSGTFNASIAGTKGLFGSQIKNKKLRDIDLGSDIDFSGMAESSRDFATKVMKGTITQYPFIQFAPLVIQSFFDEDNKNYTDESLVRDTVNDIVINNGTYTFDRPTADDISQAAPNGSDEFLNYRTVPFLNLKYVINKLFAALGYNCSGDFIDESMFDKLFLFNNCGIEIYNNTLKYDINTVISLHNHVPDVKAVDFLKNIMTFFNLYPTFPTLTDVVLRYRQRNFSEKKIVSLNGKLVADFSSTIETDDVNGYKVDYTWDDDGYYSDMVRSDLSDKIFIGTVSKASDLPNLTAPDGVTFNTNCIAFVTNENLYYSIADATSDPIKWEVYAEGLNPFIKIDGSVVSPLDTQPDDTGTNVDLAISTLSQYTETDTANEINVRRNKLATSQKGSWFTPRGKKVESSFGVRIFYIDVLANDDGDTVPQSFNHNTNADGDQIAGMSLALNATNGLKQLHEQWQDFRLNPETFKVSVIADKKILHEIDQANVIEINNVQFLPYQINKQIPITTAIEMQLIAI